MKEKAERKIKKKGKKFVALLGKKCIETDFFLLVMPRLSNSFLGMDNFSFPILFGLILKLALSNH